MDGRQQEQEQYDRSRMNANWWAPEGATSGQGGANAPILEPRMSQLPMNLVRDDPRDNMTLDTASQSRATTDSVWSFESTRDIHEFIREYNGRRYNAQNSPYFLPAGELSLSSLPFWLDCPPRPLVQMNSSTAACGYPKPRPLAPIPYNIPCSVTSNTFAIV
jgi:hypothetical protein